MCFTADTLSAIVADFGRPTQVGILQLLSRLSSVRPYEEYLDLIDVSLRASRPLVHFAAHRRSL